MITNMYKKGFTLIEILLAIAILAAMGTLVYGTFARSYDGKVFVELNPMLSCGVFYITDAGVFRFLIF